MILTIAKQRFLSNIMTMRFTISFILCVVLFVASTFILTQDYTERLRQYQTSVQESENALKEINVYARLETNLNKPPSPLSIINEGGEKRLGSSVAVSFDQAPTVTEQQGTRNPLLAVFPSLDLTTVIEIIISLLVLFFAYNTISGEREQGTMKLILSNNVPRHTVLLGNFIGGMASIVLPMIVGLSVSMIIMYTNPLIALNLNDHIRLLIIFILAVMYLSAFYSLGMLLSSRIRSSATVLILLLFIWVVSVIIVPNSAVYFAKYVSQIPDRALVDSQAEQLEQDWMNDMDIYASEHPHPLRSPRGSLARFTGQDNSFLRGIERNRSVWTGNWPFAYSIYYAPRELMEWYLEGSVYGHNLRMDYEDRIWQLYRDYQTQLEKQTGYARAFSLLSVSRLFYNATSSLAGTSEADYLTFIQQASGYRGNLISYMKDKGGLDSYLLFTRKPVDFYMSARELLDIRDSQSTESAKETIAQIMNYTVEPLDLSDLPRFGYSSAGIVTSIARVLPEIMILIFMNMIFFLLAWVSFLRADVR
ncbi:ABC transporter permease subunit [Candidatus Latescibacterota bacterium]